MTVELPFDYLKDDLIVAFEEIERSLEVIDEYEAELMSEPLYKYFLETRNAIDAASGKLGNLMEWAWLERQELVKQQ